jgi:hypothetical protein
MKKLIALFFALIVAIGVMAQERTLTQYNFPKSQTYYKYTAVAADTLIATNQDTIDIPVYINKDFPVQWYANFQLDTIAGADTTVIVKVLGKVFADESWTDITNNTSSAVSAQIDHAISLITNPSLSIAIPSYSDSIDFTFNADSTNVGYLTTDARTLTVTQTYTASYYRYLLFRLIISGDDATGTGVKLEEMELKLWERKF